MALLAGLAQKQLFLGSRQVLSVQYMRTVYVLAAIASFHEKGQRSAQLRSKR